MSDPALILDPGRSRYIWHEIKKYPAIFRLYTSNMDRGIYGALPETLRAPLRELQGAAVEAAVLVDVVSTLSKIELDAVPTRMEESDLQGLALEVLSFLQPVEGAQGQPLVHIEDGVKRLDATWARMILTVLVMVLYKVFPERTDAALRIHGRDGGMEVRLDVGAGGVSVPSDLVLHAQDLSVTDAQWQAVMVHVSVLDRFARHFGGRMMLEGEQGRVIFTLNYAQHSEEDPSDR